VSPHFEQLFATCDRRVRKRRQIAATTLISDANTSCRTAPTRRVRFPPLQFLNDSIKAPHDARSCIPGNVHVSCTVDASAVTCVESIDYSECENEKLCEDDGPAANYHFSTGTVLTEKSANFVLNQKHDTTMCAENASAIHFDINTPSCEIENSEYSEHYRQPNKKVESETETFQNRYDSADQSSMEPLRVLSFSHIDRSLSEMEDPVDRVICAAELNENMSELLDKETSVNDCCCHTSCADRPGFICMLNTLTPHENLGRNNVLVSDTPVSEYSLSYRQRALKAGNIRLRQRTNRS